MSLSYQRWPFLPTTAHSPDQSVQWWGNCFVRTAAIDNFLNSPGSAAIIGNAGSGKSTALAAYMREAAPRALKVLYPPQNWPHGPHPWVKGRGHVSQIMAATANELIKHLESEPQKFLKLHSLQQEFLFWLIHKHLRPRTLARFIFRLGRALEQEIERPHDIEDIYPSDTEEADVLGQISELIELTQAFSFNHIIILCDLNETDVISNLEDLTALFSSFDLMEQPGYAVRAAFPNVSAIRGLISTGVSGRLTLVRLDYAQPVIDEMIGRHLLVATNQQFDSFNRLASASVLKQAIQEIKVLYDHASVAGWLNWTETTLAVYAEQSATKPLTNAKQLAYNFYLRHAPLRLDTIEQGVWRGPQFLSLDRQPFDIMTKLFELRGRSSPDALAAIAGSPANLNTLISRLRKIVEPIKGRHLYIQNRRDQGYWLENFIV